MDQYKIGQFIAERRKECGLTQRQLADALAISDKTVSKWETGRGLPDVSLMLPLCEALGVTVNDLLTGQRVEPADYQQKAEENRPAHRAAGGAGRLPTESGGKYDGSDA